MRGRRPTPCTLAALLAVALLAPGAAAAGEAAAEGGPAAAAPEGPATGGAGEEKPWEERLAEAAARIEAAEARLEKAEAAYSRARHDDHPRGEALEAIEREYAEAGRELEAARSALPELVEEARRAGVPPGVLRPYWD